MSDKGFADFVAGRTIAIIGPGWFGDGDLERIRRHDLVYLIGDAPWDGKVDIRFGNRVVTRAYERRNADHPDVVWLVSKTSPYRIANARRAKYPSTLNINQVTGALVDLDQFEPADVNVYGADLYIAGHEKQYRDGYPHKVHKEKGWKAISTHRPHGQHAACREIMLRRGWFSDSPTYRSVLEMSTDEYVDKLKKAWNAEPVAQPGWAA